MLRLYNQQSITWAEACLRRVFLRWRFGIEDRFSFVFQMVVASLSTKTIARLLLKYNCTHVSPSPTFIALKSQIMMSGKLNYSNLPLNWKFLHPRYPVPVCNHPISCKTERKNNCTLSQKMWTSHKFDHVIPPPLWRLISKTLSSKSCMTILISRYVLSGDGVSFTLQPPTTSNSCMHGERKQELIKSNQIEAV